MQRRQQGQRRRVLYLTQRAGGQPDVLLHLVSSDIDDTVRVVSETIGKGVQFVGRQVAAD
jgi:hypothetical protein